MNGEYAYYKNDFVIKYTFGPSGMNRETMMPCIYNIDSVSTQF